ncbi:MAG: zinc metallopeptidase [Gammaproteobacteria bacterium]|nr:zinc metallopeptidase [Gammaproteobacteria bacterium]MDH5213937.1 zinc metallopeptidase [Gammaproteobacteria bacterium]
MRWRSNRHSKNIVDRRAGGGNRLVGGGIGTIVVILAALYFGIDPSFLIEGMQTASVSDSASHPKGEDLANDPLADRVSRVIADTEQVWQAVFAEKGQRYEEPRLVLFRGATRSACGLGEAAMGPFYCPADQNAYIDLGFYQELEQRFGAPGDFAQAYVIAHEIGHHVQNLLGISGEVQKMRQRLSEPESNSLSVKLELQADCLAGVWAKRSQNLLLEEGDLEEALNAASAIGDDRLQRQTRGTVTPDSFTHGTSEQRRRWFKRGLEQGEPDSCDTFSTGKL